MPKANDKRTVLFPLKKGELEGLLDVLQGELKELALLVLLTRRHPKQLIKWKLREVVPLVEALAQEYQSLPPTPADALLFPRLAQLPPRLSQMLTHFLVSLPAATPQVGCQDECQGEGINTDH